MGNRERLAAGFNDHVGRSGGRTEEDGSVEPSYGGSAGIDGGEVFRALPGPQGDEREGRKAQRVDMGGDRKRVCMQEDAENS